MKPKFTDEHKFTRPYADASESSKEGYLRRKFQRIAQEQREKAERDRTEAEAMAAEVNQKVRKMK